MVHGLMVCGITGPYLQKACHQPPVNPPHLHLQDVVDARQTTPFRMSRQAIRMARTLNKLLKMHEEATKVKGYQRLLAKFSFFY